MDFKNTRSKPTSTLQAKNIHSNNRIKKIVKRSVQQYIESFFNGEHRNMLRAVSPESLSFNTEASFDGELDPTQRKLQIARYFNKLKNILPAVLVIDSGIKDIPHSIGGKVTKASWDAKTWKGVITIQKEVDIGIVVGTRDMDSTDELSDLILLMFNELMVSSNGHYITGNLTNGEDWVVTLPNSPVDGGGSTEEAVHGDPTDRIYYVEIGSFPVMFEDKITYEKDSGLEIVLNNDSLNNHNLRKSLLPEIIISEQISVNQQHSVTIKRYNPTMRVYVSNANIATISPEGLLTPRRVGSVDVLVDERNNPGKILVRKTIQVV